MRAPRRREPPLWAAPNTPASDSSHSSLCVDKKRCPKSGLWGSLCPPLHLWWSDVSHAGLMVHLIACAFDSPCNRPFFAADDDYLPLLKCSARLLSHRGVESDGTYDLNMNKTSSPQLSYALSCICCSCGVFSQLRKGYALFERSDDPGTRIILRSSFSTQRAGLGESWCLAFILGGCNGIRRRLTRHSKTTHLGT